MPLRKVCGTTFNDLHPCKKEVIPMREKEIEHNLVMEGRRYGSEGCFAIVFRHAGPLGPIG